MSLVSISGVAAGLLLLLAVVDAQVTSYRLRSEGTIEEWGHPLIKRNHTGTTAGRPGTPRSWIDLEVKLPNSRLRQIKIYTHRTANAQTFDVRLQIWKADPDSPELFTLMYEKKAELPTSDEGIKTVDIDDEVYISADSLIGFTVEGINPISFDFEENYQTYFHRITSQDGFPIVGEPVRFLHIPYPALFSIAVTVDTRIPGATGATGQTGPAGPLGPSGNDGVEGATGPKGDTGDKGDKGDRGENGLNGPAGPTGPQGMPGPPGGGIDPADDDDECLLNTDNCQHTCVNTLGSFRCQCETGYQLNSDGRTCSDIDECKSDNGGCYQLCDNTLGSFTCTCLKGYLLAANNRGCVDINECKDNTHNCQQACVNTAGGFTCIDLFDDSFFDFQKQFAPAASAVATMSVTGIVWMTVLTVIVFIVMAVSFRRWRFDYCRRQHKALTDDSDTTSIAESSFSDSSSVPPSTTGKDTIALDLQDVSVVGDARI